MFAALALALLGEVAGAELRQWDYAADPPADNAVVEDARAAAEKRRSVARSYFDAQKGNFESFFTTKENALRESAREMLALHQASSFKANTDMDLAKAEYDRIKPLGKQTEYMMKAYLKAALQKYKAEEKISNKNLGASEKSFSKWLSTKEKSFGYFLKGQSKEASKDSSDYMKKLEAAGGKAAKDIEGLGRTFEKDQGSIGDEMQRIAETTQEAADAGDGAAAELERLDTGLEEKLPQLMESEEEPYGLGPAMENAETNQDAALEHFSTQLDAYLDKASLGIADQSQALGTDIQDAATQAAEASSSLEQKVATYSDRGGTLEGLLDADRAKMRKGMEAVVGHEAGKLQQAEKLMDSSLAKLEHTNTSAAESIDQMSDQMDVLVEEFQDLYERHIDATKSDATQQRKVTNTSTTAGIEAQAGKVAQQGSIDTQEVVNSFHSELATAEGQLGSMDETLQGTKRKVLNDQNSVTMAVAGLAMLLKQARLLPEVGQKAADSMERAMQSPKMQRASAEADQVKVDALKYGQDQQEKGVAELGQLGLDLEGKILTSQGGMKQAVLAVGRDTDEAVESVKQGLRPVKANLGLAKIAMENTEGLIASTTVKSQKNEEKEEELINDAQGQVPAIEDQGRADVAEQLEQDTAKVEESSAYLLASGTQKVSSGKKVAMETGDLVRTKATDASEAEQIRKTAGGKVERELEALYNVDTQSIHTEGAKLPLLKGEMDARLADYGKQLQSLQGPRGPLFAELKNNVEVSSEQQVERLSTSQKDTTGQLETNVKNDERTAHTFSSKDLQELQGLVAVGVARVQSASERAERDADTAQKHVANLVQHAAENSRGQQSLTAAQNAAQLTQKVMEGMPKLVADLDGQHAKFADTVTAEVADAADGVEQSVSSKTQSAANFARDGSSSVKDAQHTFTTGLQEKYVDTQMRAKDVASAFSAMSGTVANSKHMISSEQRGQESAVASVTGRLGEDDRIEMQRLADTKLAVNKDSMRKQAQILQLQRDVSSAKAGVAAEAQDFMTEMQGVIPQSDPTNDLNIAMQRLAEIKNLQAEAAKRAVGVEGDVQDRIEDAKADIEAISQATTAAVQTLSTGKLRAVSASSAAMLPPVRDAVFGIQNDVSSLVQEMYNITKNSQWSFDKRMDQVDDIIVESEGDAAQLEKMKDYTDEEAADRVLKHVTETSTSFDALEKWRDEVMVPDAQAWQSAVEDIFGDMGHTVDTDAELSGLLGQGSYRPGRMTSFRKDLGDEVRHLAAGVERQLHSLDQHVSERVLAILKDSTLSDNQKQRMIRDLRSAATLIQSKLLTKLNSIVGANGREFETIAVGNQRLAGILQQAQLLLGKEVANGGGKLDGMMREVQEKMKDLRELQQRVSNSKPGALLQVGEGGNLASAMHTSKLAAEADDSILEHGLSFLEAHLPPARVS